MAFDKNNPKNRKRRKVCQFCVDKATFIDTRTPQSSAASCPSAARSCRAALPVFAQCTSVSSPRL